MPPITLETSVGQIVVERPLLARVFSKYHIDYCCGGKLALGVACAKKSLDAGAVLAELEAAAQEAPPETTDWAQQPLAALVQHLLDTHHVYLREELPRVAFLAEKVARVHGDHHPELHEIARVYERFQTEMLEHLPKEEQVLFPAIVQLEAGQGAFPVNRPIWKMESEHEQAGRDLEALRELTGGFAPPEDACNSYRALFAGLADLEADTHAHIHKENNLLFPRALALLEQEASR